MNERHAMVDIETMDTEPTAAILSIGAVIFDPYQQQTEEDIRRDNPTFNDVISLESNMKLGRTVSAGTIMWWLQQSESARHSLLQDPRPLDAALVDFRLWVGKHKPIRFWANDPDFDGVILKNAFGQCRQMWPFNFWDNRSVRTIKELAHPEGDFPPITVGTAHEAKDDAIKQALMVQYAYKKLNI